MKYLSVEEARNLSGLRVAFTRGVPGPWGVGARAILELKGIAFHAVEQVLRGDNEALKLWTGQDSAPCAMFEDERPRSNWSEIILLAERLAPEPRVVPENEEERVLMFGLCHELCGEHGLGWSARLILLSLREANSPSAPSPRSIKYRSGTPVEFSVRRLNEIIEFLAHRLETQKVTGHEFLVGHSLSAADIYWAAFSNMLVPWAPEVSMNPEFYLEFGRILDSYLEKPIPQALIDHRDRIVDDYFIKPMIF